MHLVIVEDETVVARRIERLVRRILGPKLTRIDTAFSLRDAIASLDRAHDAIVLLDLNLSGDDGFELLHRAVAEPFRTIVISANTDRAVEAFDLGVVDFVAKPFAEERLAKALERVLQPDRTERRVPKHLAVTLAGRVDLIPLGSVIAIHGADDYSELETIDGRRHLHKKTLVMLERLLPAEFQRVHRSHLVNLRFAQSLITDAAGRRVLRLSNGSCVPVSRTHAVRIRRIEDAS